MPSSATLGSDFDSRPLRRLLMLDDLGYSASVYFRVSRLTAFHLSPSTIVLRCLRVCVPHRLVVWSAFGAEDLGLRILLLGPGTDSSSTGAPSAHTLFRRAIVYLLRLRSVIARSSSKPRSAPVSRPSSACTDLAQWRLCGSLVSFLNSEIGRSLAWNGRAAARAIRGRVHPILHAVTTLLEHDTTHFFRLSHPPTYFQGETCPPFSLRLLPRARAPRGAILLNVLTASLMAAIVRQLQAARRFGRDDGPTCTYRRHGRVPA
ncbi:hypothetical protein FB451DRAFT_1554537 [Mycena latifolia]|nr:hypothetical protein FB451DRAFT_1554537 [Mycena latifolia]